MAVCCGLFNCFGASSHLNSLLDMQYSDEQDHEVVEVFHPAWSTYPDAASLTTDIVRAELHGLNLMNKTALVSCCLMLHKLSSQAHVGFDVNVEFANQHISGYDVRDEGNCTVISLLYNNQSIECSCLCLDGFRDMITERLKGEFEVVDDIDDEIVKNKVENLVNFYITSLATCSPHPTTGGKSQSTFMQTANRFFITKEIKEKEYLSFKIFGDQLLEHIGAGPTCFNLPWGVYKVVANGEISHFLVTDKLRITDDPTSLTFFDLKGIQGRKTQDQTSTLLDADFVDEMLKSGFSLSQNEMNELLRRVERDANFLQMVNVMDYSLLVGWDKNRRIIVYSIIDYLVQFDKLKKLEYVSNSVRWNLYMRSLPPTVIPPMAYAKRLSEFVRQNFRTIRATNEGNVNQSDPVNQVTIDA